MCKVLGDSFANSNNLMQSISGRKSSLDTVSIKNVKGSSIPHLLCTIERQVWSKINSRATVSFQSMCIITIMYSE